MHQQLHRLVYYSSNVLCGTDDDMRTAIASILAVSQRNNARVGVTGALMYNAGCFAQVLEGDRAAVEHVFERIQRDDRHAHVSILAFEPAPEREFANWSMALASHALGDAGGHRAILGDRGFNPREMSGDSVASLLHRIVLEEEHAAS